MKASSPITEREAFIRAYPHLDLTEVPDAWGGAPHSNIPMFKPYGMAGLRGRPLHDAAQTSRHREMVAVQEFAKSLAKYLDPVDDALDKQTYEVKKAGEFDLPDDAEYEITLTAKLERAFNAALIKIDVAARNPEALLQFSDSASSALPSTQSGGARNE